MLCRIRMPIAWQLLSHLSGALRGIALGSKFWHGSSHVITPAQPFALLFLLRGSFANFCTCDYYLTSTVVQLLLASPVQRFTLLVLLSNKVVVVVDYWTLHCPTWWNKDYVSTITRVSCWISIRVPTILLFCIIFFKNVRTNYVDRFCNHFWIKFSYFVLNIKKKSGYRICHKCILNNFWHDVYRNWLIKPLQDVYGRVRIKLNREKRLLSLR